MTEPTTTLKVTFVSESAAYKNTFGWYNRVTGYGGILFADVEQGGYHAPLTPGVSSVDFTVNTADLGNIEFFLISDGYNLNQNDSDDFTGAVKVIQLSNGSWAVADVDSNGNVKTRYGKPDILQGEGANALFTETSKNAGGVDYASSVVGSNQTPATLAGDRADGPTGLLAWEDLAATRKSNGSYTKPGDADYNDAVFQISTVNSNRPPVAVADSNSGDPVVESGVNPGNTPFAGDPSATGNVLTNDTDVDVGDTRSVTAVNGSATNVGTAIHGTYGTLTLGANGQWTYSLDNADADTQALAQNEPASDVFTYTVADAAGATSSTTLTINVTGTNDAPVITGGPTTGSVKEDVTPQASGQLAAVDPDHGAVLTWSVVGAPASGNTDYHFRADSFLVTKGAGANLIVVLQDDFSDGNPPPSSPPLNPGQPNQQNTSYAGIGTFAEAGGKLLLDSNNAVSFVGVGNPNPVIGQDAIVRTNIGADPSLGLKINSTFDVVGVFDLILPDNAGEGYGIRLTDRLVGGGGNPPDQPGNNVLELAVRESQTGVDRVLLRNIDFANDVTTNLGSIPLNLAFGADQIRLHLSHSGSDGQTVHASFDYLLNGNVIATQTFDSIGVTGTIFQGENWVRPEIVASAPSPFGIYGNLNIDQNGHWTYTLDNSRTATQSLAEGQTAIDTVTVQVVDEFGAVATQTISVTVVGTNDGPVMQTPSATRMLGEDDTPALMATGQAQFSDADLTDTHSVSATLQSATLSTGASLPAALSALLNSAMTAFLNDPATGDGHGGLQWNFALGTTATQFLAQGETLALDYHVNVADPFGASTFEDVTINVTGANDAPTITGGAFGGTVTEDQINPVNGQFFN
jgi:VCBS repeat-containing protein